MKKVRKSALVLLCVLVLVAVQTTAASAHDPTGPQADAVRARLDGHVADPSPGGVPMVPLSDIECEDGMAGIFPCENVDLSSFTPLTMIESSFVNDVWGWKDRRTKMELAIVGSFEGTVFLDVTDGENPVYLGLLPAVLPGNFGNIWGDIRVYRNTAYIGTEAFDPDTGQGNGVQIVDLRQFRRATGPIDVVETNRITDLANSHNLSLNEKSGRLYVVGATAGLSECEVGPEPGAGNGGALIYDVKSDPRNPVLLGCMTQDGYTHDIQCVRYRGPDKDYRRAEICIGSNEDTVTIYDATDPAAPVVVSKTTYLDLPFIDPERGVPNYYTHQGWLNRKHDLFFLGDELDEFFGGIQGRSTYIFDLEDLDAPKLIAAHKEDNTSIDHNMFINRGLLYQSNYTAGLTVFDIDDADEGELERVGSFDVFPADDRTDFFGTWGNYPFFGDDKIVVTSSDEGVFVLELDQ